MHPARGLIERLPHGPAILSSSLIVPMAALNHIYLSGNQAASTMEAVHLCARARGTGKRTGNRASFGQSHVRDHTQFRDGGDCLRQVNRRIADRSYATVHRVSHRGGGAAAIDFSSLTQFNYRRDNWINSERLVAPVDDD